MTKSERNEGIETSESSDNSDKPSFDNLIAFVTDERVASVPIETKNYTLPPQKSANPHFSWERKWNILGQYLGTDKTHEEIGEIYGRITREAVRARVERAVVNLHKIQSPEVQSARPLSSFDFRKPAGFEGKIENTPNKEINKRIEEAIKDKQVYEQLREEFTPTEINRARIFLKYRGIEVPSKQRIRENIKDLKNPDLSDEEK